LTGCLTWPARPCECAPASTGPAQVPEAPVSASVRTPAAPIGRPAPALNEFRALDALKDVHFGSGRSNVLWADSAVLEPTIAWLGKHGTWRALLEGYSNDRGTKEETVTMGERRAKAALKSLVTRGVEAERITTTSHGWDRPVRPEKPGGSGAKNRRVHFL